MFGLLDSLLSLVGLGADKKRRKRRLRRPRMGIMTNRRGGGYTRFGRYIAYGGARGPWRGYRGHSAAFRRRGRAFSGRVRARFSRVRRRRF